MRDIQVFFCRVWALLTEYSVSQPGGLPLPKPGRDPNRLFATAFDGGWREAGRVEG